MNNLKSCISEAYKVQFDCLEDSGSDSYVKIDIKEKMNELVRLREAMKEKKKQHYIQKKIQILIMLGCAQHQFDIFFKMP